MHLSAHLQETLSTGSNFGGPQMSLSGAIPCAFLAMVKQTRDIPRRKSSLDSKNAETFPRTRLAPLRSLKSSAMLWNPSKLIRNTSTSEGMKVIDSCDAGWSLSTIDRRITGGEGLFWCYVAGELWSHLPELQRLKETSHVHRDGRAQESVWTNITLISRWM